MRSLCTKASSSFCHSVEEFTSLALMPLVASGSACPCGAAQGNLSIILILLLGDTGVGRMSWLRSGLRRRVLVGLEVWMVMPHLKELMFPCLCRVTGI